MRRRPSWRKVLDRAGTPRPLPHRPAADGSRMSSVSVQPMARYLGYEVGPGVDLSLRLSLDRWPPRWVPGCTTRGRHRCSGTSASSSRRPRPLASSPHRSSSAFGMHRTARCRAAPWRRSAFWARRCRGTWQRRSAQHMQALLSATRAAWLPRVARDRCPTGGGALLTQRRIGGRAHARLHW